MGNEPPRKAIITEYPSYWRPSDAELGSEIRQRQAALWFVGKYQKEHPLVDIFSVKDLLGETDNMCDFKCADESGAAFCRGPGDYLMFTAGGDLFTCLWRRGPKDNLIIIGGAGGEVDFRFDIGDFSCGYEFSSVQFGFSIMHVPSKTRNSALCNFDASRKITRESIAQILEEHSAKVPFFPSATGHFFPLLKITKVDETVAKLDADHKNVCDKCGASFVPNPDFAGLFAHLDGFFSFPRLVKFINPDIRMIYL